MTPQEANLRPEAWKRAVAGFLVHASLAGRRLPPFVPGEPRGLAALRVASHEAPAFLENLEDVYGVKEWTLDEYERVFLRGALEGWRPGSAVKEEPGRLRVVSGTCPLAAEADADPRVCQACRAFQEQVTRLALPGQVERVRHTSLITSGDGVCVTEIELKDAPAPPGDGRAAAEG